LVLKGAEQLLTSPKAPRLIIELHGAAMGEEVYKLLQGYGYQMYDLQRNPVSGGDTLPLHLLADPPTI